MARLPVIHRLTTTPSTQDALHELAALGAEAGTAVAAQVQTMGRGSRGRGWESPLGGLWLSVLLRPAVAPALEVLSVRVALAAARAIEEAYPAVHLGLKWPNDLMLAGKKLGGILCEARWQAGKVAWVAAGIGVNVANAIPPGLEGQAVALSRVASGAAPESLVEPVARAIALAGRLDGHLDDSELECFAARDWLFGKRLTEPEPGVADGLAADGTLRLRGEDGHLRRLRSGTPRLAG
ncbi:MAG TPA: biotin--[acetyl-CoA-carboxylase] ligase [Gemmatimonadales bacterium]|nr:biotin--[acetyl-CoA-carboxylase] ligase [Gemmatimonadales bacterium]